MIMGWERMCAAYPARAIHAGVARVSMHRTGHLNREDRGLDKRRGALEEQLQQLMRQLMRRSAKSCSTALPSVAASPM
jgi:hypothetical protein